MRGTIKHIRGACFWVNATPFAEIIIHSRSYISPVLVIGHLSDTSNAAHDLIGKTEIRISLAPKKCFELQKKKKEHSKIKVLITLLESEPSVLSNEI